jgi:hypothetical protein
MNMEHAALVFLSLELYIVTVPATATDLKHIMCQYIHCMERKTLHISSFSCERAETTRTFSVGAYLDLLIGKPLGQFQLVLTWIC